ncbi:MAG: CoB--CoM heterodisulfide reductase iron-sulfur subunit B family protein [bacterium]
MKFAFYPGCSLESSAREYAASTACVARGLGIELEEIPGWVCCGSTPAHMSDRLLAVALPAHTLLLAQAMKTDGVLVSCASCYSRLKAANHAVKTDPELRRQVANAIGGDYDGGVPVQHMLEVVSKITAEPAFQEKVKRKLTGLKVASYYGCLLVRPPKVAGFDDAEDPQMMDRLVAAVGGEPVAWRSKVECCGAALAFTNPDIVLKLSGEILEDAKESGADLVAVACPLCQSNLDLRQRSIERHLGIDLEVPVVYFTQIVGLALGCSAGALGLGKHIISPVPVLKRRGIHV